MRIIKKVVQYKTKQNHYNGSPCIIWCFDDRFSRLLDNFKKNFKKNGSVTSFDIVKVAGGAKCLVSGPDYVSLTIVENIKASIKLHKCPWVGLMVHADCGAYGRNFSNNEEEKNFYVSELMKAKKNLRYFLEKEGSIIPIRLFYADFQFLYEVVV